MMTGADEAGGMPGNVAAPMFAMPLLADSIVCLWCAARLEQRPAARS